MADINFKNILETSLKLLGPINCEQALQVELGIFFKSNGYNITFEKSLPVSRLNTSINKPKHRLDILIEKSGIKTALELKVPLNGRHPETMFEYCKDIEFVESLLLNKKVDNGYCLLLTNDKVFWTDSGRGSQIHNIFRVKDTILHGKISKPTGSNKPHIFIKNVYKPSNHWKDYPNQTSLRLAKYLLLEITA